MTVSLFLLAHGLNYQSVKKVYICILLISVLINWAIITTLYNPDFIRVPVNKKTSNVNSELKQLDDNFGVKMVFFLF